MNYAEIARESRLKVLELVYKAQTSHIGSLLGATDIFAVLFEKIDLDKDKFVLSAGWKAALLYYHMWRKGLITQEELDSYCQEGSKWIGLAEPVHEFIPIAGGSMGLGLPGAVGIALAKKIRGEEGTVYCLMSDGEMAIGTTWESILIARHHKLDNLVVIVEVNGYQAMGRTDEILEVPPLASGGNLFTLDNTTLFNRHTEASEVSFALETALKEGVGKVKLIYIKTVKGKGVSFMENNNTYHYKALSEEEYHKAKKELS